jgi:arylsulfatase A-like enzyme
MPEVVDGYNQVPLPGVSMRYSFDAADAPTTKQTQYYEMLGTRGVWHQGWKALTEHGPVPIGLGHFDQDHWQLFHTDVDRAEAHDLADQHPDKLEELKACGSRRPGSTTSCRSTTSGSSSSGRSSTRLPCQQAGSTSTTRAPPRSPRRRRPPPSTSPTRSWPRSSSPPTPKA